jgi:hypothetical protein
MARNICSWHMSQRKGTNNLVVTSRRGLNAGSFSGEVKWQEREADLPPSVEVNAWHCVVFMRWCLFKHKDNVIFKISPSNSSCFTILKPLGSESRFLYLPHILCLLRNNHKATKHSHVYSNANEFQWNTLTLYISIMYGMWARPANTLRECPMFSRKSAALCDNMSGSS